MCGKVVRKEGMGRDSSKLQYKVYKPDLHNTTIGSVFIASEHGSVGECACDFTHSRKLHRRIFRIMLHYSTVCAAPAQNT